MTLRKIMNFADGSAMAAFAAGLLGEGLLAKRGRFTAALSGGKTPGKLFRELARLPLPWERAVFYMADERRVPFSSRESNFGAAGRAFFSPAGVPRGSLRPPSRASAYSRRLRADTGGTGTLDLVFLGLGEDGHTASLFPGAAAEHGNALYAEVMAPKGITPRRRLTLTLKAINKARLVVVLVSGRKKKGIFFRAAGGDAAIPGGRLNPRGKIWFLFSNRP